MKTSGKEFARRVLEDCADEAELPGLLNIVSAEYEGKIPLDMECPRKALFECLREHEFASERQIVFGMANNFVAYILLDNDFMTDRWLPYINFYVDRFDTEHYEETVSTGPQAAKVLTEAFRGLFERVGA